MLLGPLAVRKLKDVTRNHYWPDITHEQRNDLARMFMDETGRLLDQKSESKLKYLVERVQSGELGHAQYIEEIEQISLIEGELGAQQGREYARNHTFEFAQKELHRVEEQAYTLELLENRKQYEIEKRKTEQSLKTTMQQFTAAMKLEAQQHTANLEQMSKQQKVEMDDLGQQRVTSFQTIIEREKEELARSQEQIRDATRREVEEVLSTHLQEERDIRERELFEQFALQPAREAVRNVQERITLLEKEAGRKKRMRTILFGCGVAGVILLVLALLFVNLQNWLVILILAAIAVLFLVSLRLNGAIHLDDIAGYRKEVHLFQTRGGSYSPLDEQARCALLVERTTK